MPCAVIGQLLLWVGMYVFLAFLLCVFFLSFFLSLFLPFFLSLFLSFFLSEAAAVIAHQAG